MFKRNTQKKNSNADDLLCATGRMATPTQKRKLFSLMLPLRIRNLMREMQIIVEKINKILNDSRELEICETNPAVLS